MNAYYEPYWNVNDDELEHHGILGQKWGIRRYQNKDGTLTDAGKKRYGTAENLRADRQKKKEAAIKVAKTAAKVGIGVAATVALGRPTARVIDKLIEGRAVERFALFTKHARSEFMHNGINSKTVDILSQHGSKLIDNFNNSKVKWKQAENTIDYLTRSGIYSRLRKS